MSKSLGDPLSILPWELRAGDLIELRPPYWAKSYEHLFVIIVKVHTESIPGFAADRTVSFLSPLTGKLRLDQLSPYSYVCHGRFQ